MKTLIVNYTPRQLNSNTKKLLDHFISVTKTSKNEFEMLDLTKDVPDFFLSENLGAYYARNYGKQKLTQKQTTAISKMDKMTKQFKSADIIVLAYPMYNFSLPGIVKAYFDSILQKGETWDMNDKGYVGLMKEKKALIISTSGGAYSGNMASWEHSISLSKLEFNFMGFSEIESVVAEGINMNPGKTETIFNDAKEKISKIAKKWYR